MDHITITDSFIAEVEHTINQDHLILPSVPDTVIRIQALLDDPDASNDKLAQLLSTDAALAARILKVANSVTYTARGGTVDSLTQAVSRLGHKLIKILVTNHAMMQIFYPKSGKTSRLIQKVYEHSVEVGRLSYAIASYTGYLSPDDALLAGLVHDIGYLPLLQVITKYNDVDLTNKALNHLMIREHSRLGGVLLKKWNFPANIIEVAEKHENITRDDTGNADLVDVIRVADIILATEKPQFEPHRPMPGDMNVYIRLALTPECGLDDFREKYEAAGELLPDPK